MSDEATSHITFAEVTKPSSSPSPTITFIFYLLHVILALKNIVDVVLDALVIFTLFYDGSTSRSLALAFLVFAIIEWLLIVFVVQRGVRKLCTNSVVEVYFDGAAHDFKTMSFGHFQFFEQLESKLNLREKL